MAMIVVRVELKAQNVWTWVTIWGGTRKRTAMCWTYDLHFWPWLL